MNYKILNKIRTNVLQSGTKYDIMAISTAKAFQFITGVNYGKAIY